MLSDFSSSELYDPSHLGKRRFEFPHQGKLIRSSALFVGFKLLGTENCLVELSRFFLKQFDFLLPLLLLTLPCLLFFCTLAAQHDPLLNEFL